MAIKKWRQRADPRIGPSLLETPVHSLYQRAYNRFCYDFATPSSTMARLLQMLPESPPDSCFRSAVAAVSYANYHGRSKSQEAYEASGIHYGRTLQKLACLIPNTTEMQRDEVMIVVLLLGIYEMLTSTVRDGSWITHMQGTESVLAHRKTNTLSDGHDYFVLLCIHLAVYYLQETKYPGLHFDSWVQQIPPRFAIKKQMLSLMSMTASICVDIRALCTQGCAADTNGLVQTGLKLLKSAQTLDMKFARWAAELPHDWTYVIKHPMMAENRPRWARELFSIPGAPEYMYSYKHLLAASDWSMYRATRIRLNLALLEYLSTFSFPLVDTPAIKARVFDLLLTLSSEIASTIPCSIGLTADGSGDPTTTGEIRSLSAYGVLFSSQTCLLCFSRPLMKDKDYMQQATWFKHVLLFLRDIGGISKAQVFVEEERAT